MPDDFITRSEYETRHSELRTEMISLRAADDTVRRDMLSKFDQFGEKIEKQGEELKKQIEVLDGKIVSSRAGGWKLVALSLINFMVGAGSAWLVHILTFGR